jgi:hypothetical protein
MTAGRLSTLPDPPCVLPNLAAVISGRSRQALVVSSGNLDLT